MADQQKMKITVKPGGKTKIDVVQGPGGSGCTSLISPFATAIGETTDEHLKPEYYEEAETSDYEDVGLT